MTLSIGIKINKTLDQMQAIESGAIIKIQALVDRTAFKVEAESMKEAPVRTGFLRNSHQVRIGNLKATVVVTASYAPMVHDGTRYIEANPFLDRARMLTERWLVQDELKRLSKEIAGKL